MANKDFHQNEIVTFRARILEVSKTAGCRPTLRHFENGTVHFQVFKTQAPSPESLWFKYNSP